jgi:hypothetical protein
MKTLIKGLLLIAALIFIAPKAHAQRYSLQSATITSNSVTVTAIAATATNTTVRADIPATKAINLGIQASFVLAGSGTSAVVLKFDESLDGSNWESAAHSLTITANGTSSVVGVANLSLGGIGFIRLSSVENPNANAINSLVIKYAQKSD